MKSNLLLAFSLVIFIEEGRTTFSFQRESCFRNSPDWIFERKFLRPHGRSILEFKLRLSAIFFSLPLYVFSHYMLIYPNGWDKIPDRPDSLWIPVNLIQPFESFPDHSSCITFYDIDGTADGHLRRNRDQKIHVIQICIHFKYFNFWISPLHTQENLLQIFFESPLQYLSSILRADDDMVLHMIDGMCLPFIFHAHIVAYAR